MTDARDPAARPVPELATGRLLLRPPGADDADAIVAGVGDREVARRLGRVPHPYGLADAAFFLERVVPREWAWAITLPPSPRLVGVIGLAPTGPDSAELGYWLARDQWGSGLTTEAGRAVVAHGFGCLRLSTITSAHQEDNQPSARVLAKLGFVPTGRSMRPCLALGRDVPSIELHLLRPSAEAWAMAR